MNARYFLSAPVLTIAAIVAAAALNSTAAETGQQKQPNNAVQWEYKVVSQFAIKPSKQQEALRVDTVDGITAAFKANAQSLENTLNDLDLGENGWELVVVTDFNYIFKRPKSSK